MECADEVPNMKILPGVEWTGQGIDQQGGSSQGRQVAVQIVYRRCS